MHSQSPKGRMKPDGTRSHSTYGSRDHYSDSDPQHTAKPTTAKKTTKQAADILNKAFKDEHKKGVAEGYSLGKVLPFPELLDQILHILTTKHRGIGWKTKKHSDNTFVFSALNDYRVWSMLVVEGNGDDWVTVGHGIVTPEGNAEIFDRQQLPMTLASASEIADEAIQTYHDIDLSDYADTTELAELNEQGVAEGLSEPTRKVFFKVIKTQGTGMPSGYRRVKTMRPLEDGGFYIELSTPGYGMDYTRHNYKNFSLKDDQGKPITGHEANNIINGEQGVAEGLSENAQDLHIGDPVIITGNGVEFEGATGEIIDFGRDHRFVVVDLYNHGRHSFHSSDVSFNEYAGSDDEEARAYDAGEFGDDPRDDMYEARMSAALRMANAVDKQRAKSNASLARTPGSIPKKEEPKKVPTDSGAKTVSEHRVNRQALMAKMLNSH